MNYDERGHDTVFNNKTLRNPLIRVEGNIISSEYDMLQISSISRVWVGHRPPAPKSLKPMLLGILFTLLGIGSFVLWVLFGDRPLLYIAGALILIGVVGIVSYVLKKPDMSIYALNIQLNSGSNYAYVSSKSSFITDVFNVLHNILLHGNHDGANYIFNFSDGTIVNNSSNVQVER